MVIFHLGHVSLLEVQFLLLLGLFLRQSSHDRFFVSILHSRQPVTSDDADGID